LKYLPDQTSSGRQLKNFCLKSFSFENDSAEPKVQTVPNNFLSRKTKKYEGDFCLENQQ
jgi:hypothetical protein